MPAKKRSTASPWSALRALKRFSSSSRPSSVLSAACPIAAPRGERRRPRDLAQSSGQAHRPTIMRQSPQGRQDGRARRAIPCDAEPEDPNDAIPEGKPTLEYRRESAGTQVGRARHRRSAARDLHPPEPRRREHRLPVLGLERGDRSRDRHRGGARVRDRMERQLRPSAARGGPGGPRTRRPPRSAASAPGSRDGSPAAPRQRR